MNDTPRLISWSLTLATAAMLGACAEAAEKSGDDPSVDASGGSGGDARPSAPDAASEAPDAAGIVDADTTGDPDATADADTTADAGTTADATPAPLDATPGGLTLVFASPTDTAQQGNVAGGTAFNDACPAGQVVIGLAGSLTSASGYHAQMNAVCGTASLVGSGASLSITIAAGTSLPSRGMVGTASWSRSCPADHMIVGFVGRSGALIDQLTFSCAPLTVTGATVTVGVVVTLAAVGGGGGSAFPQTSCPTNTVATVARIRAGDSIDAFGLGCSAVTIE